MSLAAALIYWIIIALWLAVLATLCVAFARNPRTFGALRVLMAVLVIDTVRNIVENLYFGLYFGSLYGLLPASLGAVLGNPAYLILPKVMNVVAALVVLAVLAFRWLPLAARERASAEATIRQHADALSQESQERRRLFETSLDLILITDRGGTFMRVSPSSLATLGYRPDEMIGRSGADFVVPEDLDRTRREMRLARGGHAMRDYECRYLHKDGRVVPLVWSGVWSQPEQRHYFIGRDMTEQRAAEAKLRQLAMFDQLTGLPNRTRLNEVLDRMTRKAARAPFAVATFDIDGFKVINDTLGQSIGDRLLREVAGRMSETAGEACVYRRGGDEFVVVMEGCGEAADAVGLARRILARLAERIHIDGHSLFIAASAGVALAPQHGGSVEEIVSSADLAQHEAKAAGGQAWRLFAPEMRARAQARHQLDIELRRASANGEFVLHFQPQIRAGDRAVAGAETLLRWNHPERGLLAPGEFIEALAQSAVAAEVGRWILATACATAAGWNEAKLGDIRIAVNLFPAQFRNGTLLDDVDRALAESGLRPEALELEITENIALDHDDSVPAPLSRLRERGVGLAFDDFGTGYASLSYLTRYPLTRIKIDRSFVSRIAAGASREDTAIVRSIIAMARNLGLQVTAEGVETPAQAAFLTAEGCHELQGYHFARPLPAEEFARFVLDWKAAARKRSRG